VLPVGGIKEKVVAALRAGIKRVMLPARNRKDYEDIPDEVRRAIELIWLENIDDAVAAGLGSAGEGASAEARPHMAADA
jgi:ATP-dependent Lon protease